MKKTRIQHCFDKEKKRPAYAVLVGVKEGIYVYYCSCCTTQFEVPANLPKTK